jgi:hypothetical protein
MNVKFLIHGNNDLPLTGFKPVRPAILKLLVRCVNYSATPPLFEGNVMLVICEIIAKVSDVKFALYF